MSACDECSVRILSYLEDRLDGQELAEFRAHVEHCSTCRASVEAERSLSQLLRQSRPLYSAPPSLRARVAATVELNGTPPHIRTMVLASESWES
jgi:mycothiol system anti-sigma-R factor